MGFKAYHPVVNLIYFVLMTGFSCFFMNPVCLAVSALCAASYFTILKKGKAIGKTIMYFVFFMIAAALINPLFNHRGVTIIAYFPNSNPLTLEAIVYGIFASVMIGAVILWFSCLNQVLTSDKIIYLFGRIIPSLSLIFSMTLRFVPRFVSQIKEISKAHKGLGKNKSGGVITRTKNGLAILSAAVTWALENSIDTADSMKARGYGIKGRTAFSIFKFDKRDFIALLVIIFLAGYVLWGIKILDYSYYPSLEKIDINAYSLSVYAAYLSLGLLPTVTEITEVIKWKAIKSKI